jgi:hypothetical protein
MNLQKNKKGGVFQGTIEIIFTLLLFFIFYPFISAIFDGIAAFFEDGTVKYIIESIPFFILAAVIFWIFSRMGEE